jgi:hypothetical protein
MTVQPADAQVPQYCSVTPSWFGCDASSNVAVRVAPVVPVNVMLITPAVVASWYMMSEMTWPCVPTPRVAKSAVVVLRRSTYENCRLRPCVVPVSVTVVVENVIGPPMDTKPDPAELKLPTVMLMEPPACVAPLIVPAFTTTLPPVLEDPEPTEMLMAPPRPDVAMPVMSDTKPVLPLLEKPLARVVGPEAPRDSAAPVAMTMDPEPEFVLEPDTMLKLPPVP